MEKNKISKFMYYVSNILYYFILIFLIIITISISIQSIKNPDKIPNIFGYKIFMVLDEKMDKNINYGDLVFTKNVKPENLNIGDLIAYRVNNIVIIHEIESIKKEEKENKIVNVEMNVKIAENEVKGINTVKGEQVEGIINRKIPKIGSILFAIQKPINLAIIIGVILFIGSIFYFIAWNLDKKEEKQAE